MSKKLKGGPGSGNWGHMGRPGTRGGSASTSVGMSIASGPTARARQALARNPLSRLTVATKEKPKTRAEVITVLEDKFFGNLWEKHGHSRVYFDSGDVLSFGGLSTQRYKTGNISGATLKGESISNSEARKIGEVAHSYKIYYDLKTRKVTAKPYRYVSQNDNFDDIWEDFSTAVKTSIGDWE